MQIAHNPPFRQLAGQIRLLGILFAATLLLACQQSTIPEVHGYLYFGAGNYLGRLNLRTGTSEIVANLGNVSIGHLSTFHNNELLLSVHSSGRRGDRASILAFDLLTNRSRVLLPGSAAHHLPEAGKIIYDNGSALIAVPSKHLRSDGTVVNAHKWSRFLSVVTISNAELLYASRQEQQPTIYRYSLMSESVSTAAALSLVCTLDGALWIADLNRLLCTGSTSKVEMPRLQLVTLDGHIDSYLDLPTDKRFRPVAYLEDQRILLLSETSRSWPDGRERNSVWVYDLTMGDSRQLTANQYLGDAVVYRPSLK